jgi:two-component system CheB/CheR fusion protein
MLPLVGLGGSAGSIGALKTFFEAMPADSGMSFVVILHLAADHDSRLPEVLQRATTMRVVQVSGVEQIQPNTVYVIPPGKALEALDGKLRVAELRTRQGRHVAVDLFLRTLADYYGPHATAVILSGMDGDGAIGIKRIKERGGLTIAQDPDEAEHSGMPRSAIATGMVDWVLPVRDMAARLLEYRRHEQLLRLPPEDGPQPGQAAPAAMPGTEAELYDVLSFLRTRTGRDFSYYKRATILRRIARRMQVNSIEDLPGYLDCLRTRPGEAAALLQDLLISVTNFFRDPECFAALEERIPELFEGKTENDTVRVWVAACATGEEAYSIAMLLNEYARTLVSPPLVQMFATDLSEDAIRTAREAIYPATIEADVSDERLRRFFIREHRGYRVRRDLRETVLFALHDLLKDAPFSRLDLVSCRNLLIYLNRDAQARALDTFHFALLPAARLFLGSSESAEDADHLFAVLDKKNRLYAQRPVLRPRLPVPSGPSSLALALTLDLPDENSGSGEGPAAAGRGFNAPVHPPASVVLAPVSSVRGASWGELHFKLLELYAPPSVLVNADHDILHLSAHAGSFLQYAGGEPTRNLLRAVHPSLRIELRAALYQAAQTGRSAVVQRLQVQVGSESLRVTLRVAPAGDAGSGLLLVIFEAQPASADDNELAGPPPVQLEPETVTRHLDQELDRLKSHLRSTVEQYEASTEELKASNEELQSMNEELRSATEELETSREELQSINEELTTVNHELKSRVDELGHANSDMHNLMDATAIATVFLDRELRIKRYTPSAVALFNLIPTDVGRPLANLTSRLHYDGLGDDAMRVLERLVPIEREVGADEDQWYLVRLLPYRTIEDRIAGVVLTLVDVTERKRSQEELRASETRFRAIVNQASVGVVLGDLHGRITFANARHCQLMGCDETEMLGAQLQDFIHPDDADTERRAFEQLLLTREPFTIEQRLRRKDGSAAWVHSSVTFLPDARGEPESTLAVSIDVTERKQAEAALRRGEEHLRLIIENARDYAIFSIDTQGLITSWNAGAERLLGYAEAEVMGRELDMIFTEEDRVAGIPALELGTALREGRAGDDRFHRRKDGSRFWASGVMTGMRDAAGAVIGCVKILRDQSEVRQAQQALELAHAAKDQFLAVLSHELRTPLTPVAAGIQLLSRRDDLPSGVPELLAMMHRNIRIESHLIDDLLDLTHISRGTVEVLREPMDLHEAVQGAIEICRADITHRQQALSVALDATEHRLLGDSNRLQQAVWNLLKNASKFTPKQGRIALRTWSEAGRITLEVSDNGAGIDASAMPRIFDAFAQGGAWVTREFGGLGLGLAITRATVQAHGGLLRAYSDGRGQGARFQIELPLMEGERHEDTAAGN